MKRVQIGKFRFAENTAGLARAHTVFTVHDDGFLFVFGEFANLARQTFQGNIFGVEKMPVFKLLVIANIQKQGIGVALQPCRLCNRKRAARRGGTLKFGEHNHPHHQRQTGKQNWMIAHKFYVLFHV